MKNALTILRDLCVCPHAADARVELLNLHETTARVVRMAAAAKRLGRFVWCADCGALGRIAGETTDRVMWTKPGRLDALELLEQHDAGELDTTIASSPWPDAISKAIAEAIATRGAAYTPPIGFASAIAAGDFDAALAVLELDAKVDGDEPTSLAATIADLAAGPHVDRAITEILAARESPLTPLTIEEARKISLAVAADVAALEKAARARLSLVPSPDRTVEEHMAAGIRTVEQLIDAGSLGTPEAKAIRARANPEAVRRILDRLDAIDEPIPFSLANGRRVYERADLDDVVVSLQKLCACGHDLGDHLYDDEGAAGGRCEEYGAHDQPYADAEGVWPRCKCRSFVEAAAAGARS